MSKRTATKVAPKMHTTQESYAMACALYETAVDASNQECIAKGLVIVEGMADDAWETMSNTIDDVQISHNVWSLQTLRVQAERAMILWSLDASEKSVLSGSEAASAVSFIRGRVTAGHTNLDEWRRLVDIGFRLAA